MRTANHLTEEAREDRKKALRSIAYQLHARGLTQRQIAEKLGVAQSTVGSWLNGFGGDAEIVQAPALPDQATLDRIAAAIKGLFPVLSRNKGSPVVGDGAQRFAFRRLGPLRQLPCFEVADLGDDVRLYSPA